MIWMGMTGVVVVVVMGITTMGIGRMIHSSTGMDITSHGSSGSSSSILPWCLWWWWWWWRSIIIGRRGGHSDEVTTNVTTRGVVLQHILVVRTARARFASPVESLPQRLSLSLSFSL